MKINESGSVEFVHKDDKTYTFTWKINDLNGSWMYTWDNWFGCFAGDKRYVRSVIKDIKDKAKVLNLIGVT